MITNLLSYLDGAGILVSTLFVLHVIGNFVLTSPAVNVANRFQENRFDRLSLFPPSWVFAIWLVIWTLHSLMLVRTYGTGFWTPPVTGFFILICLGNIGSQWAGATGLNWSIYLPLIGGMLIGSLLFMKQVEPSVDTFPILKPASQLYVGWASIAFVVGLGVILVCDLQVVSDAVYTPIGVMILVAVPIVIWALYLSGKADYRYVSAPYFLVLLALGLRLLTRFW